MFDPSKHRKTATRLAELKTKAPKEWKVDKPKQGDFIQIYGDTLADLDLVNLYVQRDGGGYNTEWLIQGDTEKDEEEIISYLNTDFIKCAYLAPCVISASRINYFWLGKQGSPFGEKEPHKVHIQIKGILEKAQHEWTKAYWHKATKEYLTEPAEEPIALGDPVWPSKEDIYKKIDESFKGKIITNIDHEIVKRTRGLIR